MAAKRKLNCLTLESKRLILAEVDKRIKRKGEICKQFGIPKSTLSTFLKNRAKIQDLADGCQSSRKRHRKVKFNNVEQALFAWIQEARDVCLPISGPILMAKGEEFAEVMGINFKANSGWLHRFRKRYGITHKALSEESLIMGRDDLLKIFQDNDARNIYIAEKLELDYSLLPSRTFDKSLPQVISTTGGNIAKSRLTVLVSANMDGSNKLPLLNLESITEGNFQESRYLITKKASDTNLSQGHVIKSYSQSWTASSLFESWVRSLDAKFKEEDRKIVILIANCSVCPGISGLESIKLMSLPSNVRSMPQPFFQGIIASMKKHYRETIMHKLKANAEQGKNVDGLKTLVLNAMCDLREAWNNVSSTTISICFHCADFVSLMQPQPVDFSSVELDIAQHETHAEDDNVFESEPPCLWPSAVSSTNCSSVKSGKVQTTSCMSTSEEIITSVFSKEEVLEDTNNNAIPSTSKVRNAIDVLRRYVQNQVWQKTDQYLNLITNLEVDIDRSEGLMSQQSVITSFFIN